MNSHLTNSFIHLVRFIFEYSLDTHDLEHTLSSADFNWMLEFETFGIEKFGWRRWSAANNSKLLNCFRETFSRKSCHWLVPWMLWGVDQTDWAEENWTELEWSLRLFTEQKCSRILLYTYRCEYNSLNILISENQTRGRSLSHWEKVLDLSVVNDRRPMIYTKPKLFNIFCNKVTLIKRKDKFRITRWFVSTKSII